MTNWAEIYWRLSRYWPNDRRFQYDQFGQCPVSVAMSALEWGSKLERERLHSEEMAVAQLCAAYLNSQKTGPPYFGIADVCLFAPKEDGFPQWLCDCFVSLIESGDLPTWVCRLIPLDIILLSSTDSSSARHPRLLMAKGIALIGPREVPGGIRAGAAVSDGTSGILRLTDIDSGEQTDGVVVPLLPPGCYLDIFISVEEEEDV